MRKSFRCQECGRGTVRLTYVTHSVPEKDGEVTVKGVPVGLCPRCGQQYYEDRVLNRVKELAALANGKKLILYTNEHAIPGMPNACPEDELEEA